MVLYTDGVTEAMNRDLEMYSSERLCRTIRHNHGKSAKEIQEAIIGSVYSHLDGSKPYDDITLPVMQRVT